MKSFASSSKISVFFESILFCWLYFTNLQKIHFESSDLSWKSIIAFRNWDSVKYFLINSNPESISWYYLDIFAILLLWWVQVKNFRPGLGQIFVARVGSAGLGFALENFSINSQTFQFFALWGQKKSHQVGSKSTWVKAGLVSCLLHRSKVCTCRVGSLSEVEKLLSWLGIEPPALDLRSQSGAFDHSAMATPRQYYLSIIKFIPKYGWLD